MNELYGGFGSTPIDDDILSMFGGTPSLSKPQAQAQALRTKPRRESTSITQNVVEQSPAVSSRRALSDQQATGQINAAQQEIDKYTGPQDYTAMQDYAKQRAGGGQKSLLLALAAQTAGKEYAPVGAAYLKRAMESREPLKTATGFIDETGQHIEDPQAQAMQRLKVAEAKMARAQQILQSNASAEEKAAAQQETLALRREQMQATMALRQMSASIAQQGAAGRNDDRRFRGEDRMKNDFEQVTKSSREGLQATTQIKPLLATAANRKLNNVEQQALITLFNKFLDPGSVVREGEFDRMAKGMGLGNMVANWQDKILQGSIITPAMVADIGRVAAMYEKDALQNLQQQAQQYEVTSRSRGYDPEAVVTDPRFRSQPAPAAGPPEGAVRVKGAQPAPAGGPPPGAVRLKGQQ